jgi:hypothetical protein
MPMTPIAVSLRVTAALERLLRESESGQSRPERVGKRVARALKEIGAAIRGPVN